MLRFEEAQELFRKWRNDQSAEVYKKGLVERVLRRSYKRPGHAGRAKGANRVLVARCRSSY
jgi:hypothetical protein